jgi:WD40 repeat protein
MSPIVHLVDAVQDTIRLPFRSVTSLAGAGDYLACTGSDMVTRVYDVRAHEKPLLSIPTYRGDPTCVAISVKFRVFVSGTNDGSLMICSLETGEIKSVVSLAPKRTLKLAISPGWGFIVAWVAQNATWELVVLTVNGNGVLTRTFEADCVDWDIDTNDAGFDFLTIALRSGNVYRFELCGERIGERVVRIPTIVAVQYIGELDAVAVVTSNGTVQFVPAQATADDD